MSNRVVLSGRLCYEPELKTTNNGKEVVNFRIAVPRIYDKDNTDFFDIVAWEKTAVFLCQYFRKGDGVEVDGQLRTRQYQAKDGTNRTVVEIYADNVSFPPGKGKQSNDINVSAVPVTPQLNESPTSKLDELNNMNDEVPTLDDDDLPF